MIEAPLGVLAVLLGTLAVLFTLERHPRYGKVFRFVPLIVCAYFVPTLFSNTGLIPITSPLYGFVREWLLPASLVLLVLSVDVPAILRLGRNAVALFLTGTVSIVLGGPLAYLALGWLMPESLGEEAWKGLAALSGSWIGGGANFIAVGSSVGARSETISMMVIADVAVANVWTAFLLYSSGREKAMDARIGADRTSIERVQREVERFQAEVARPTNLPDLLSICAIAFGVTAVATSASRVLPPVGTIISGFTWVVVLVTTAALAMSFTPLRRLEGAGASRVGSVFLYLLITTIGAHAEFRRVLDAPALVAVAAFWMVLHALSILAVRRFLRAPIFFAAVGSQANVGGAASAPIVAAAFHPALAPVGVLLAIAGYVLGTYGGILCAALLEWIHRGVWM
ncbi:MAG TPA: DUF819 family protein [Myxococcaceae bacterium]|nr:DUF819 family protein [Myxococcaceae bacterium]